MGQKVLVGGTGIHVESRALRDISGEQTAFDRRSVEGILLVLLKTGQHLEDLRGRVDDVGSDVDQVTFDRILTAPIGDDPVSGTVEDRCIGGGEGGCEKDRDRTIMLVMKAFHLLPTELAVEVARACVAASLPPQDVANERPERPRHLLIDGILRLWVLLDQRQEVGDVVLPRPDRQRVEILFGVPHDLPEKRTFRCGDRKQVFRQFAEVGFDVVFQTCVRASGTDMESPHLLILCSIGFRESNCCLVLV